MQVFSSLHIDSELLLRNRSACSYQLQSSSTVNAVGVTRVFAVLRNLLCCCEGYLMTGISGDDGNTEHKEDLK